MKVLLSVLKYLILIPLSIVGALALLDFYLDNKVTEVDRVYDILRKHRAVEAFGLNPSINLGGNAELWLTNGGFIKFGFASARVLDKETQSLIYQIGEYELKCHDEVFDAVSPWFNQLGEILGLEGGVPLSRIIDDYDNVLRALSRLPTVAPSEERASKLNCWTETAPVHEFYMYPPVNIKQKDEYVYWREARPICPTFLRFPLCDTSYPRRAAPAQSDKSN